MKKYLYNILLTALPVFLLSSCFDESGLEKVISVPTQVEFDYSDQAQVVGHVYNPPTEVVSTDSIRINLIGPHQAEPVNVQWTFQDGESTAIEGVHFRFATDSRSVTIPANSSYAYVPIEILMDNFEIGEEFDIVLEITSADVPVAPNLSGTTYTFFKQCPSNIPLGNWVTNVTGANGQPYVIEIASTEPGKYTIANFNLDYQPSFYGTFTTLPIGGGFSDVCNTITLGVAAEYGVTWSGVGTYDEATQTITFASISDPAYGQGPWNNGGAGFILTKE